MADPSLEQLLIHGNGDAPRPDIVVYNVGYGADRNLKVFTAPPDTAVTPAKLLTAMADVYPDRRCRMVALRQWQARL